MRQILAFEFISIIISVVQPCRLYRLQANLQRRI